MLYPILSRASSICTALYRFNFRPNQEGLKKIRKFKGELASQYQYEAFVLLSALSSRNFVVSFWQVAGKLVGHFFFISQLFSYFS